MNDITTSDSAAQEAAEQNNIQAKEGVGQELNLVLDIPVKVSVEIGTTKMPIKKLLQLNQGSIVELDRLSGEPLDVKVNGKLVAHGEVVVVDEKYGVRLTDVISESERMVNLTE